MQKSWHCKIAAGRWKVDKSVWTEMLSCFHSLFFISDNKPSEYMWRPMNAFSLYCALLILLIYFITPRYLVSRVFKIAIWHEKHSSYYVSWLSMVHDAASHDAVHHHTTVLIVSVVRSSGRIFLLRHCFFCFFHCPGLRQVVDHLLGSRPWSRPYIQRADHAQRRPHTLCCTYSGEHTHTHTRLTALQINCTVCIYVCV